MTTFTTYLGLSLKLMMTVESNDLNFFRQLGIRIMTYGKLKGSAFLTFPTVLQATKALIQVNGYVLRSKPLVIVTYFVYF